MARRKGQKARLPAKHRNRGRRLSLAEKRQVVSDAREYVRDNWTSLTPGNETGWCLYAAMGLVLAAKRRGVRLIVQAGTAAFRRINPDEDDGVIHTHFVYEWEGRGSDAVQARIRSGLMPEMHVWCADPRTQEIIDITLPGQPAQCRHRTGMPWTAPALPDFFWGTVEELSDKLSGAYYEASMDAIEYTLGAMRRESDRRRSECSAGVSVTLV